jgi:hypothetical protein
VGVDLIELLALELALEGQQAAGLAPWPEVAPARWGSAASVIESGLVVWDHLSSDYASVMREDSTEWHTYTSIFFLQERSTHVGVPVW